MIFGKCLVNYIELVFLCANIYYEFYLSENLKLLIGGILMELAMNNSEIMFSKPSIELAKEEDIQNDAAIIWFIVIIAFVGALGIAGYCIYKGMDFVAAIQLNPFKWEVGCRK